MKISRLQIVLLLCCLLALGGLGLFLLWHFREYINREQLMALVDSFAEMGPWAFFSLMALMPLFWMPLSPFLLLAPAFGMPVAVVGTMIALSANMLLAWLVSGKWFRPLFVRLVNRFGYSVPVLSSKNMIGVAVLLRITPGMPFPMQNYLLGLAGMPLGRYLAVSLPIMWFISLSLLLLGESVMQGNWGLAFVAVFIAVLVALILRYVRGRLATRANVG